MSDSKTIYAGYLTVPGASTDPIQSEGDSTIGGDIVKNFKAIGDIIQKNSSGGINIGGTGSSVSSSGCCIDGYYTSSSGTRSVMLSGLSATATVPYSVNTMQNKNNANISGIAGWCGMSNGYVGSTYSSESLGIHLNGTGYGVVEIDAIYVNSSNVRTNAQYRLVIDYSNYSDTLSTTLVGGTDSYANTRFSLLSGSLYIDNPDNQMYYILNMRYTLLDSASSTTYSSGYGSYSGSYS